MTLVGSLYDQYMSERMGANLLDSAHGFIVYRVNGKELFIQELFVAKDSRRSGNGLSLMKRLFEISKEASCEYVTGSIFLWDKNASETLRMALNFGFKVVSAQNGTIFISKEVGD